MSDKHQRHEYDYYITPPGLAEWGTLFGKSFFSGDTKSKHPKLSFLEPGCGIYAPFADAAFDYFGDVTAVDIQPQPEDFVPDEIDQRFNCDFLAWDPGREYDLIVGNPPFKHAKEFVLKGLELLTANGVLVYLLRLSFLASMDRRELFFQHPPDTVTVLQKRPSFTGDGKTDGQEYAFFAWRGGIKYPTRTLSKLRVTKLWWLDNSAPRYNSAYLPDERIPTE